MKGYWLPVLHHHLPFVKHPEYDYFLEEHWLFEAITETYIPLLKRLYQLKDENIDFRLTVSITPPLAEMLEDEYLIDKYEKYLDRMLELTEKEIFRTRSSPEFNKLAYFYNSRFKDIKDFFFNVLNKRVLNGYRHLKNEGNLEIITCNATHGFLPLLNVNQNAVERQVKLGVEIYEKCFNSKPNGIWLAECAYYDGLDRLLDKYGIKFTFLDTHGLTYGKPTAKYGVYAPVYSEEGVAFFGRDPQSSKQVWSSKVGYPGDSYYREFYRDIGFDLDFDYIKPYISPDGHRVFTGIKYYRITGDVDLSEKEPYIPEKAQEKALEHAKHFHFARDKQLEYLSENMDRKPVIVSPYDAELFGHWWFEGVDFLYYVFKEIYKHKQLKAITPMEYLAEYPENQVIKPAPSSWGDKGYYEVWLNPSNDWIYKHLHYMADTLDKLNDKYKNTNNILIKRVLKQMERELLLAQSSDWAFLITMGTAKEYATKREKEHINNFLKLEKQLREGNINEKFLKWLEYKNSFCT